MIELLPIERTLRELARVNAHISAIERELARRDRSADAPVARSGAKPSTASIRARSGTGLKAHRMRTVLDAIPFQVYLKDHDGRFVFVNHAMTLAYGLTIDQLVGTRQEDTETGQQLAKLMAAEDEQILSGERSRVVSEHECTFADGKTHLLEFTRTALAFPDPQSTHVLVVVRDMTQRRATARARRREARLSELGRLTTVIAKEVQAPLSVIGSAIDTIATFEGASAGSAQSAIDRARRNHERCNHLVNQLLEFTQDEKLDLRSERIGPWLERVLSRQHVEDGVELAWHFESPDAAVTFDRERLAEAIGHVVRNAAESILEPVPGEPRSAKIGRIQVASKIIGNRLDITVDDDGPGIPENERAQIFEPLYSSKIYGTGFGLALVRQILERHGGGVEVDDNMPRGARFILWLPVKPAGRAAR